MLRIRKPQAIQSIVTAARYRRRRDRLFGSLENDRQEMQTDQNRTRLTRPASCDTHVAFSDNAHAYHRSHERNSKRSMSGPSLDKDSSVFGGVNLKYFSSGVNATIAAERNVRHQGIKIILKHAANMERILKTRCISLILHDDQNHGMLMSQINYLT